MNMVTQLLRGTALTAALALAAPVAVSALTPDEAKKIALDAYVYGYSLITTDVTRVQMTSVGDETESVHFTQIFMGFYL